MRLAILCVVLLAGCPGKISNPEKFLAADGEEGWIDGVLDVGKTSDGGVADGAADGAP